MAIDILSDPFSSSASLTDTDFEGTIRDVGPSLPDTKVQDLVRASERESFDKQEGINEQYLLDKEYLSVATNFSAELGPFTLDIYERAQPLVQAAALRTLNEGDRTGSFRGRTASGGSQWDIQQITAGSLNPAEAPGTRVYNTGGAGTFNVAPAVDSSGTEDRDPSNDSSSNIGSEQDGTHKLDDDTQFVMLMGMQQSTNPRAIEQAQIEIDDGESRTPFDVYSHQVQGSLQVQDLPSVEYITSDDSFDINATATADVSTDFYPFGIDFNTQQNLPDFF